MDTIDPAFPHLWRCLRHSIFRDEYRPDFADAERQIDIWTEVVRPEDTDKRLGLELLKAIHCILVGKIYEAESILRSMSNPDSKISTNWQLRAESYRRLIIDDGAVLHAFDSSLSFPDFQSAVYQALEEDRFQRPTHLGQSGLGDFEEEWTLLDIMAIKLRTTASRISETSSIRSQNAASLRANQNLLQQFDSKLASYAIGYCYPYKLRAEIAHVQGIPSDGLLNAAFSSYKDMAPRGYAACLLLKGDWTVSHPFSNPTSLGIVICESTRYDGASRWDSLEDSLELKGHEEASQIYDEALRKFADTGGLRGKAAIYLRKACLVSMSVIFGWDTDFRLNQALHVQCRRNLDHASLLFEASGDLPSIQLVSVHKTILEILVDPASSQSTNIVDVGKWGASTGSFVYAHDLGLLLLRTGLFMWRRWRAVDSSKLLLEAAQALFSALGAQGTEAQAEAAIAKISAKQFDLAAARVLFLGSQTKLRILRTRLLSARNREDALRKLDHVQLSLREAMASWDIVV